MVGTGTLLDRVGILGSDNLLAYSGDTAEEALMDTGDAVLHLPTGEARLVAYVHGETLCCCGWPESFAPVRDCQLIESATPEARLSLLRRMAAMPGRDSRKTFAQARLAEAENILPSIY